jgi:hypothetical protein
MSEWRYIPGFDKHYEISSFGDVKSIQRNVLLKHRRSKTNPREFVVLTTNSGVFRFYVDDLVCRSFLPDNWFESCKIIHLDGDITNNSASNLICTQGVENLPLEVWKAPSELKNHVCVSNFGRVKRIDHIYGECEHLLRMQSDFDGYDILNVSIAGNSFSYRLHRLVATLFLPNPNNFPDINHKDGNKKNNSLDNLEWCSKKMNMEHAVRLGLCRNDSEKMKNKNRELRSTIIQCVETGKVFESILAASIYYNVSHGTISDIVNGKTKSSKQIPYHFKIIKKGDKTK